MGYHGACVDDAILLNHCIGSNDRVGENLRAGADLCIGMDHGARMDERWKCEAESAESLVQAVAQAHIRERTHCNCGLACSLMHQSCKILIRIPRNDRDAGHVSANWERTVDDSRDTVGMREAKQVNHFLGVASAADDYD